MAWYYEDSILSTASWFTYLLEMKYRKENQYFICVFHFVCICLSLYLSGPVYAPRGVQPTNYSFYLALLQLITSEGSPTRDLSRNFSFAHVCINLSERQSH